MSKANLVPDSVLKPYSAYAEIDLMEWARDMINRKVEAEGEKALESALAEVGFVRERTCELDGTISFEWQAISTTFYTHSLSCGHDVTTTEPEPPNYCEECGAKVAGR